MKESDRSSSLFNQIQRASYQSGFKDSKAVAKGILLRVLDQNEWGYSSLQPWTHLGDPVLDESNLKSILNSELGQRALELAKLDAYFRREKKSLLDETPAFCHYTVLNFHQVSRAQLEEVLKLGFTHIKVKLNAQIEEVLQWLKSVWDLQFLKWRFDFNNQLNEKLWESFCLELPDSFISKVEFVEDPFLFNAKTWKQAQRILPLALDFQLENPSQVRECVAKECAEYFIYKPSARALPKDIEQKIVITSYMDHPIGISHALAEYQKLKKERLNMSVVSGLGTIALFEDSQIFANFKNLQMKGPLLTWSANGYGIGFDEALAQEHWQDVQF
jgi:O-succinylbenzoate synthase